MSKLTSYDKYILHKSFLSICKKLDELIERKQIKKRKKSFLIRTYGNHYYSRDKVWLQIKDQKKNETYEQWQMRLYRYNFDTTGVDLLTNEQHSTPPLIHEYIFNKNLEEITMTTEKIKNILTPYENTPFTQKRGGVFTFTIDGNYLTLFKRSFKDGQRKLPVSEIEQALDYMPLKQPSDLAFNTRCSSYIYAILSTSQIINKLKQENLI